MAKKKRIRIWSMPFRSLLPMIFTALALLMDMTIVPLFYQGIYAPNITMALILAFAVGRSTAMGFAYGVGAGLLLDISTSYPVGLYTATFLLAVLMASLCSLFERNTGRLIVISIIYLLQELAFLVIAYATTIRMEWAYFVPVLIRAASGVLLCAILQLLVMKTMKPRNMEYTRSRRQ